MRTVLATNTATQTLNYPNSHEAIIHTFAQFPYAVTDQADVGIIMSDGCRLSARIWRPINSGPVPAVLEYIPYRKRDGTVERDEIIHPYVAGHGFACVRVDIRGNGDSAGVMNDEYTLQELADACEIIEWLAKQPWCSGNVGMMGKSWGGFNALQTAFLQPSALKAVIAVCATADRFGDDIHFKGGCLLGENFSWASVMLSYSSRPADPALRPDWYADWLARLDANPWLAPRWADFQDRNAYWQHGSICEDYARITVPALVFGGWADGYLNAPAAIIAQVPGAKGIVGPWVHLYPHQGMPGPAIGFLQEALRWWDRWLKSVPNDAEFDPAYRVYMLHSAPPHVGGMQRTGHWISAQVWPSPRITRHILDLGDQSLGLASVFSARIQTPQHLGLAAGKYFSVGQIDDRAGDQRDDDALSVCFDALPLDQPLQLLGAAKLSLRLTSDQPLGFVVARLCDVAPDGSSVRIAHGMLNLCHRKSMEFPEHMQPGQVVDVCFDLDQMAYQLSVGHHLRLALSNTYWPFVWPSPFAATLMISAGRLDLPVHRDGADVWLPPPPEGAKAVGHRVIRAASASRLVEIDQITGMQTLQIDQDSGAVENLHHGLISAEISKEVWQIHPDDPLSSQSAQTWEQQLSRGSWAVRTRSKTQMTATATHLQLQAELTAWHGETRIFHRVFNETVLRRFV